MKPRPPKTHDLPKPKPARATKATPKPVPRTTAQQGADFTAEGAPPPGRVGAEVPEVASTAPRSDHDDDAAAH